MDNSVVGRHAVTVWAAAQTSHANTQLGEKLQMEKVTRSMVLSI